MTVFPTPLTFTFKYNLNYFAFSSYDAELQFAEGSNLEEAYVKVSLSL